MAETITIPYIYESADITGSGSNVIWPARFHSLIAYKMAVMFFPIDQGDKSRDWSPEFRAAYQQLKNSFIDWDASIKLAAIGGVTPYGDDTPSDNPNTLNF